MKNSLDAGTVEDGDEIYFTNIQTAAVASFLASRDACVQLEQHLVDFTELKGASSHRGLFPFWSVKLDALPSSCSKSLHDIKVEVVLLGPSSFLEDYNRIKSAQRADSVLDMEAKVASLQQKLSQLKKSGP